MLGWKNKIKKKTKLNIILDIANIIYTFKVTFILHGSILRRIVINPKSTLILRYGCLNVPYVFPKRDHNTFTRKKGGVGGREGGSAPVYFNKIPEEGEEQKADLYATSPT